MKPAIFLDRDGTLMAERDFCRRPDDVEVLPGSGTALKSLRAAGFRLVVVTNQSGIARGYFDQSTLAAIHRRLEDQLGLRLDAFLHCPHHPDGRVRAYRGTCECRKPAPGLLFDARDLLGLELRSSHSIGDSARDAIAAHSAGVRAWLVETGKPFAREAADLVRRQVAFAQVTDLAEAARRILAESR